MSGRRPGFYESFARAGLLAVLLLASWRILHPFLPAIVFAAAIAASTWPVFLRLRQHIRSPSLASLVACLGVALLIVLPSMILVVSIGETATWLLRLIDTLRTSGPVELPDWISRLPLAGDYIKDWLQEVMTGGQRLSEILSALAEPARDLALAGGRALGRGLGQTLLMAVLLFFFYRDGDYLAGRTVALAQRLGGQRGLAMLRAAHATVTGVMLGVIGAGLAQAIFAVIGFAIVGMPNPFLLGAMTFILAVVPMGPPVIWGAVALALLRQGEPWWAGFMTFYGLGVISSVDNLIKPMVVSRSSGLPFALTLMGLLGGVLAFGPAGIFIGPAVLALGVRLDEPGDAPLAGPED